MNQYPAWKYILIGLILLVGVVYALPNLFGEDPALQVTSTRGFALPPALETSIEDALTAEQISVKGKEQAGNRLLYRLAFQPPFITGMGVRPILRDKLLVKQTY